MRAATVFIALAVVELACCVQPAVAAGNPHNVGACSACHPITPRFGTDTRRDVTFTTSADDPGLCTTCHPTAEHRHPVLVPAGSGPAGARISVYLSPGTSTGVAGRIVCTSCHFIHSTGSGYGLLRGFPGSPGPRTFDSAAAFCEECHGDNLTSRSPHAGGERSCVFCHAGRPPRERKLEEAPSGFSDRCLVCHRKVKDQHFAGVT